MSELKKRPVILDCDPGVDDAVALFMMLGAEQYDLIGITPVNGNKPLKTCENNALKLCELTKRTDIPVLHGAPKAIFGIDRTAGDIHGAGGLGGVVLPEPEKKVEDEYAWDFIYRKAVEYKGELEILAIGPLSNIATALIKYPDLTDYVKSIVIMGGGIAGGNMSGSGEFNIWADTDAARIVFRSGIHIVMAGLDICMKARIMQEEVDQLLANGGAASAVAAQIISERLNAPWAKGKIKGAVLCDAVAAAYMIDPSVITKSFEAVVDVEVGGSETEGRTVCKRIFGEFANEKANTTVMWDIDRIKFGKLIVDLCTRLDASNK